MPARKKKALSLVLAILGMLLLFPLYIFFHESGHTLVALANGATITRFSIINAYMSYEGGTFTPAANALLNIAGMLLPVVLVLLVLPFYNKKATGVFYTVFSFFAFAIPSASVLAWVLVPILAAAGAAPKGDDVAKFIVNSGLPPLVVAAGGLLLFGLLAAALFYKKVPQNYWKTLRSFRAGGETVD